MILRARGIAESKAMELDPSLPPRSVITNATIATFEENGDPLGLGLIKNGALAIDDGKVAWIGAQADLPKAWSDLPTWSADGRLITPGLVECHSCALFGGEGRTANFHEIVSATRDCSDAELLMSLTRRARWFANQGVTTLEVKSGYGVTSDDQMRLLQIIRTFSQTTNLNVRSTLLAGSVYPENIEPEDFVEAFVVDLIGRAHAAKLMDSVDVYCDDIDGISLDDSSTLLEAAYKKKVPTRLQTDHRSDSAGAVLASSFYAKAAAYLNHTDETGLETLAKIGTVAVLMPGAFLEGGETQTPDVQRMRDLGIPMAVSTGFQPGISPLSNPLAAAHLACRLFGLTSSEALHGLTTRSAKALSLTNHAGALIVGAPADLAVWDAQHPEELVYWYGAPLCHKVLVAGAPIDL